MPIPLKVRKLVHNSLAPKDTLQHSKFPHRKYEIMKSACISSPLLGNALSPRVDVNKVQRLYEKNSSEKYYSTLTSTPQKRRTRGRFTAEIGLIASLPFVLCVSLTFPTLNNVRRVAHADIKANLRGCRIQSLATRVHDLMKTRQKGEVTDLYFGALCDPWKRKGDYSSRKGQKKQRKLPLSFQPPGFQRLAIRKEEISSACRIPRG